MDNNRSGPPVKRKRWDYPANSQTSSEPILPLNVNAFNSPWRSSYNGRTQAEVDLETKYFDIEKKYKVLESGNALLVKAHHDLFILYKSQCNHIAQLPTQSEVSQLNERIMEMEAEKQKKIADLEQSRVADKTKIAQFEKQEVAIKHALESEKQKCAGLYQMIDELKANNKGCEQIIKQMKDQQEFDQAKIADLENEAERLANEKGASKAKKPQKRRSSNVHQEDTLFLLDQNLTWEEYVKHVSTKSIKSLNFVRVRVEKPNGDVASLEEILGKVPNIQMFGCVMGNTESIPLNQKTFVNLLIRLPLKSLRKFYLAGITNETFDADSFLDFMKKHPSCHFILSFQMTGKNKFKAIAKKLREACPSSDVLDIQLERPNHSIMLK